MCQDLRILESIIRQHAPTRVKAREFFVAWSGVPTLAYDGFSETLLSIKRQIEAQVPAIRKENPGSLWPKTTLGALRDDKKLSWDEVVSLREICDQMNQAICTHDTFEIRELTVVVFSCRSLERRLGCMPIELCGQSTHESDAPPNGHIKEVSGTMRQFSTKRLCKYWPDLLRDGNRESHYRVDHIEATLVFDLGMRQPRYLDDFIGEVERKLPGAYCWFAPESRHMTIRALAT